MSLLRAEWRPRFVAGAAALLGALLAWAPEAPAENWLRQLRGGDEPSGSSTTVSLLAGERFLDSGDWSPVDSMTQLGVEVVHQPDGWWGSWCSSLVLATASGSASEVDVTTRLLEWQVGARKTWALGRRLRPYAGGGGSLVGLSYTVEGGPSDDSDTVFGLGLWLGGGISLRLGNAWLLGLDARLSNVNVEVAGTARNAGGLQLGLAAGYRWSEW